MPVDIQPQPRDAVAYARRRPRDGRSFNRIEARPANHISRLRKPAPPPLPTEGWPRSVAAAASLMMSQIVAGYADDAPRSSRSIAVDRDTAASVSLPTIATKDLRRLGRWVISMPLRLWSRLRLAQERGRVMAAWEAVDDHILRDIGVARHQLGHSLPSWPYGS